jgi:multidrug efflux pump subunit AcrA (membrane-fusion protein)
LLGAARAVALRVPRQPQPQRTDQNEERAMARGSTKTKVLNGALLVVVAGAGFGGYRALDSSGSSSTVTRTTATVTKGTVAQSVSATGNISALTSVDINFDSGVSSNLVTEIDVKVGDKVTKGQVLAKVDDKTVQNALASAQASLASAQANYDKVKAGLTPQDRVQVDASDEQAQVQLANAQTAVDNAVANQAQDATTSAASISQAQNNLANVQAQADRDLAAPQAAYDTANANYAGPKATRDAAVANRDASQAALNDADATVATLTADRDYCAADSSAVTATDGHSCATVVVDLAAAQTDRNTKATALTASQNALYSAEIALTPFTNALNTTTTALDNQKLKSKQSVDSATNSLTNATNSQAAQVLKDQQSLLSAQRALESQTASYNSTIAANQLKRQAPTTADMASQQVSLTNAQNSLFTAQKNAANAVLLAPAAGTVSASNGRIGYAGSNTSGGAATTGTGGSSNAFISLADLTTYEVKVGFSESDSSKVKVGQAATVSLDALNNAKLNATVRSIDSVSTLVSNVVTYYAYLTITQTNGVAVQPGMTASVAVTVDSKENVLYLPTSAVTSRGTTGTVNLELDKDPKKTEERPVSIGLRGDTTLEIKTGLNEGDVVVTVRTKVSTAQTPQTNAGGTLTGNGTTAGAGAGGFGGAGGAPTRAGGAAVGGR